MLKDGDKAVIGKHTIEFQDPQSQAVSRPVELLQSSAQSGTARAPQLDRTVFLDTAKAKEMLAAAVAASSGSGVVEGIGIGYAQTADSTLYNAHQTIGTLTILEGRTDQRHFVLSSQLTVIGKSRMAGIRLKRWFAPRVAASIYRTEDSYFLAPARDDVKIKVKGTLLDGGKTRLDRLHD